MTYECATFVTEKFLPLFNAGIQHTVNFSCCACEPIAITLARGDLWPATPHNPRLAFHLHSLIGLRR